MLFDNVGSPGVAVRCFCRVFISDSSQVLIVICLFQDCDDALMGYETFMWTKCFDSLQKQSASNLLMAVLKWYFCCGSTMFHVVMSVCVLSPAMWDSIVFVPDHCLSFYFDY